MVARCRLASGSVDGSGGGGEREPERETHRSSPSSRFGSERNGITPEDRDPVPSLWPLGPPPHGWFPLRGLRPITNGMNGVTDPRDSKYLHLWFGRGRCVSERDEQKLRGRLRLFLEDYSENTRLW